VIFRYEWKRTGSIIAGQNGPVLQINGASAGDIAEYVVTVIDRATGAKLQLRPARLDVVTGTEITAQPASLATCEGQPVRLEVGARGAALRYQWRKDGVAIPGATGATYELAQAGVGATGRYDVIVSGSCGDPVTSRTADLIVDEAARITGQPRDTTVWADVALDLTIDARGAGLGYQWRKNGVEIPGATDATYRIWRVLPQDSGAYDVVVTSECGTVLTSRSMHLTVLGVSVVAGEIKLAQGARLDVLPHPAYGETRLEITLPTGVRPENSSRLVMVDLLGREVLDLTASAERGSWSRAEFDATGLVSGMYLVRYESRSGSGVLGTVVVRK
jgi:hypothetical protein